MTLRAKARQNALAIAPDHAYKPLVEKYANLASDAWEPVLQAFLETPHVKYHGRPFYGAQYGCPACAMGRECSFAAAIRLAKKEYLDE